jgi:hypothetical protein
MMLWVNKLECLYLAQSNICDNTIYNWWHAGTMYLAKVTLALNLTFDVTYVKMSPKSKTWKISWNIYYIFSVYDAISK